MNLDKALHNLLVYIPDSEAKPYLIYIVKERAEGLLSLVFRRYSNTRYMWDKQGMKTFDGERYSDDIEMVTGDLSENDKRTCLSNFFEVNK